MSDAAAGSGYKLSGEVSERAELLNGSMQLSLDGIAVGEDVRWELAVSLAWRLGREGAVALEEGDLALDDGGSTSSEVIAILDGGSAEDDSDTGNAIVDARFTIEESNVAGFEAGAQLRCQFEVGAEQWTGSLIAVTRDG